MFSARWPYRSALLFYGGSCQAESQVDDPLDLEIIIFERIYCPLRAVDSAAALRLAKIQPAGQLTDKEHIHPSQPVGLDRGLIGQGRVDGDRAQVPNTPMPCPAP